MSRDIQPVIPIPQLNLFTRENLQMSIQSLQELEILPTGNWQDQPMIIFNVNGDPETFIDPSSLRLKIRFKVVNGNGTDLEPLAPVAPIANFGCSLFEKVSVRLGNSTQVSGFDNLYPYLSYLINVLKMPYFAQKQVNFPTFLYRDTSNHFDSFDRNANLGYDQREEQTAGSIENNLIIPVYSSITGQDRLLPPNIDMQLTLQRAADKFLIMSNVRPVARRNQKVALLGISLTFQKIRLNVGLHLNLVQALLKEPAIYPCVHHQIIEFSKTEGTSVITETLLSDKVLPSYVYLYVVTTTRRLGSYTLTPFNVNWGNLSDVKLVSGSETYPSIPYKIEDRKFSKVYMDAMDCLGSLNNPHGRTNELTIKDYEGGYGILGFNLTKGLFPGYGKVKEPVKLGELQAHIQFRAPLRETTSFVFVLEYNANIYVSSNSDVSTDFMA